MMRCWCLFSLVVFIYVLIFSAFRYILLVHKSATLYTISIMLLSYHSISTGRQTNTLINLTARSKYKGFNSGAALHRVTEIPMLFFYSSSCSSHLYWSIPTLELISSRLCFSFFQLSFAFPAIFLILSTFPPFSATLLSEMNTSEQKWSESNLSTTADIVKPL